MSALQFRSARGQDYEVDLPAPMEGLNSAFLFAFHKSGSTLMDNMVRRYCKAFSIPTFSLYNAAFDAGVTTSDIKEDTAICFSKTGRIYTGFRHYPPFKLDLESLPIVLLVRDPRDMLVSMFYSVTKSHVLPKKNKHTYLKNRRRLSRLTIDDFVLSMAETYKSNFLKYRRMLPQDTLITYRYEDVIYEKMKWLQSLVDALQLPRDDELIQTTAEKFDIFPDSEDQSNHIRQVHPGNHETRLKPATIESLNETLGVFLHHYNYL